jgi:hypothetical protein
MRSESRLIIVILALVAFINYWNAQTNAAITGKNEQRCRKQMD